MTKKELRTYYKNKRDNLTTKEIEDASARIIQHLFSLIHPKQTIALFLPIQRFNEIDLSSLLQNSDYTWGISKANIEANTMDFYHYTPSIQIETNQWGIPEPKSGQLISPEKFDCVIVPLLICDSAGNRVGYGKGFYDNFLAKCSDSCLFIGVNYFPPISSISDTFELDIPLTHCITPVQIHTF